MATARAVSKKRRWWPEDRLRRLSLAGAALLLVICGLDRAFPLRLPANDGLFAQIVLDLQQRPLRAFADHQGIWRYPVSLDQVSPHYIDALLGYEDRWFWYHPGINPLAMARALVQNLGGGRIISGGSTLSMQVARLLHPHSRTLGGKLYQMLRTLQLEWYLSKTEILELYLNIAPFGGTIEGVQAASYGYLNKPAAELSRAEAALLAVLPQSPSRLRPDRHPRRAQQARDKVLTRLATFEVWSGEQIAAAKIEQVYAQSLRVPRHAPLLSQRLVSAPRGERPPNAAAPSPATADNARHGIQSTIDGDLQRALEDYVANYLPRLPADSSVAILVADNHTQAVRAYLGTAQFADTRRFGHLDMVQAIRSPGSTLKPFLYAMAMDQGLIHSQSLLADVPRTWGSYRPDNFDKGFSGPVSATEALQRSLNVPVVSLLSRFGAQTFASRLEGAGLGLQIPGGDANLSLILGGAGTNLEQLVTAYMALANGGQTQPLRLLTNVPQGPRRYLMSPESAWITHQILADIARPDQLALARDYRSGIDHRANARGQFAWKTGTSYGYRDAWAIGVNRDFTLGVWVGRPDGTPQPGHFGRATAAPLLFAVADHLPPLTAPLPKPKAVAQHSICWPGGQARSATDHQCQPHLAWLIDGVAPPTWQADPQAAGDSLIEHYWLNPATGLRVDLRCDVPQKTHYQRTRWPQILRPWLSRTTRLAQQLPARDPLCGPAPLTRTRLKILGIEDNNHYRRAGQAIDAPSVLLHAQGGQGQLHWYINGQLTYHTRPHQRVPHPLQIPGQIQILVTDDHGQLDQVTVNVL